MGLYRAGVCRVISLDDLLVRSEMLGTKAEPVRAVMVKRHRQCFSWRFRRKHGADGEATALRLAGLSPCASILPKLGHDFHCLPDVQLSVDFGYLRAAMPEDNAGRVQAGLPA